MIQRLAIVIGPVALLCFLASQGLAQPAGPRSVPESATQPRMEAEPGKLGGIDGLTIDPEAGYVEVEATLVRREADWLELLATTPGGRTHETLLTVKPAPRQIHLGLLMIGLKPGRPLDVKRRGEQWIRQPPRGPEVLISLIYKADGQTHRVPANKWVINRETEQPLESNRWLFTGSKFVSFEGDRFYLADRTGTAISLVGFGDDLLCRDTTTTNRTDAQQLAAHTDILPAKGTAVTIRLTPAAASTQPEPNATEPPSESNKPAGDAASP
jgi:hypothetical protein